eukprot:6610220-Pyramimonas_sp.AAC.1
MSGCPYSPGSLGEGVGRRCPWRHAWLSSGLYVPAIVAPESKEAGSCAPSRSCSRRARGAPGLAARPRCRRPFGR